MTPEQSTKLNSLIKNLTASFLVHGKNLQTVSFDIVEEKQVYSFRNIKSLYQSWSYNTLTQRESKTDIKSTKAICFVEFNFQYVHNTFSYTSSAIYAFNGEKLSYFSGLD